MHRRTLLLVLSLAAALTAVAQTKRPIRETDLYDFHWIADARIAPDGSRVVYTIVNVNAKHDGYDTALWMVPAAGGPSRQLTQGPRDSGARWSPDGKTLAFLRAPAEGSAQIQLLSLDGGEARPLTDIPKGASAPAWSPDGKTIAFTSTTKDGDTEVKNGEAKKEEAKSDVRVITKAKYRSNGSGYDETGRPNHIWLVEVPAIPGAIAKARQLTKGEFSEGDIAWARDGARIFYTAESGLETYYEPPQNTIFAIGVKGSGMPVKIASVDGGARGLSVSPNGEALAFVAAINKGEGVIQRSYSQPDLWVTATTPGSTPRNLTMKYDFDIGGAVGGDKAPPRAGAASKAFWSKDGRYIFIGAAEEGKTNLKRVDADTGEVKPFTDGNHDVYSYDATPDGATAAVLISTPTQIGDLFIGGNMKLRRLTSINEKLFEQLTLTEPSMLWYKSFDGKKIQTWVQRPPDFQEGKKYPMILDIHGGPHSAYGYTFDQEFQWMAAKGYVVLYPNPRGSTSYGQDFGNVIQYHYPGDDYKDLMSGVDELIRLGWVDAQKLGVTGGSGGGLLTNWTIGQTTRFKAAVSMRSIADWSSFWYTADFTQFTSDWFRGAPWESEADYKARSPITYITKVKTPLMLIEGESDLRTPPTSGGEQMFRALKYLKVPTVMVRFPGESHELSRSGKPTHRVERLQHIVAWMDQWVLGQEIHTYDVR